MTALAEQPQTRVAVSRGRYAPAPPERRGLSRDGVRLLVGGGEQIAHTRFRRLADHLVPGDVVVVNRSATVPAAADARSESRGAVVLHAAGRLEPPGWDSHPRLGASDETWVVELRTAPDADRSVLDAEAGERITLGSLTVTLIEPYPRRGSSPTGRGTRLWRARVDGSLGGYLQRHGRPIAYGYLDRRYPLADYQTVFASIPGSAEMPSAGRPFTQALITALVAKGVAVVPVTLHTGVSSQEAGEVPQPEWFDVPTSTARLVEATRRGGGRVVAVGTTVTRALESAVGTDGRLEGHQGWTERVVTPADPPRVVTGLITGWHDPEASHLLLVEAVAGADLTQRAYEAAIAHDYAWHEFGDSALLLPDLVSVRA